MRAWVVACGLVGGAYVLGAVVAGCGTVSCEDDRTCGGGAVPSGDGGGDTSVAMMMDAVAAADVVVRPDGGACDAMKRPNEDGCQPVDGSGLFVAPSPKGNDTSGDGTKAKPFATIGGAIAKATAATRVYVCEGIYDALSLDAKLTNAVTVFGGLSCDTWGFVGLTTRIAPAAPGYALRMDAVTPKVELVDLEFKAEAAIGNETNGAGKSSIAAFISNSPDVTFRRVQLRANAGSAVLAGTAASPPAADAPSGNPGTGASPGGSKAQTCGAGLPSSSGGAGGNPGADGQNGGPSGLVPEPPSFTGLGGTNAACTGSIAAGVNGAFGPGGAGGAGASKAGTLLATGWASESGSDGIAGKTAQGGGGGGGDGANGGGGGGPGGCGGKGGASGAGGGASIALLIFKASVSLSSCILSAGTAGQGGGGAAGQQGQRAASIRATGSCSGGLGGHGGSGGGGGGGAGGVSLGIGYVGTAPTIDGVAMMSIATLPGFTPGSKGLGGTKGAGGAPAQSSAPASKAGADGTAGTDGVAQAVLALPE